jgi:hypothetical protein
MFTCRPVPSPLLCLDFLVGLHVDMVIACKRMDLVLRKLRAVIVGVSGFSPDMDNSHNSREARDQLGLVRDLAALVDDLLLHPTHGSALKAKDASSPILFPFLLVLTFLQGNLPLGLAVALSI